MIGRPARRGGARMRRRMLDLQTTVWLSRRLWRPLAADLPGRRGRRR